MLSRAHRMRTSAEVRDVARNGLRVGTRTLVVHALHTDALETPKVGFVVSRAIGNAVTRNLVKRRLRSLVAAALPDLGAGVRLLVRAKPAAAAASYSDLSRNLHFALRRAGVLQR